MKVVYQPIVENTWPRVRFGDVVRNVNDNVRDPLTTGLERSVGLEHLDPESLHIKRWGVIADGTTFTREFTTGQVLFGKRRAYQRKVAVAEFDGICSGDILVFEPANDQLLPELLPFIVQSDGFFEHALGTSAGSLSPRTKWQDLARYEFALPPLDEQRRIAEILWAADEAIVNFERVLDDGNALRRALINETVAANLNVNDLLAGNGNASPIVKLGSVCNKIVDGPHNPPEFTDTGIPFLLVANLASGHIDWNVSKWISEETYQTLATRINSEPGDVLYTVVGSFGVPVLITWDRPFAFQRHVALLKPNRELLDGTYLTCFLESDVCKQQADIAAVGNAQKTLTLGALQKFRIPLPSLEAQKRIVATIDGASRALSSTADTLNNLKQVKKKLIETLLAGVSADVQ